MLACRWEKEFMTRLSMRMKWGEGPTGIRIETGLWECGARNNPCNRRVLLILLHAIGHARGYINKRRRKDEKS